MRDSMALSKIQEVRTFCEKWKVVEFSLFGSVLRSDFNSDSDVDVLIRFSSDAHWSGFDWVMMLDELEAIYGRKVDLVDKDSLRNPFRRHEILRSAEVVYAA